MLEKKLYDLIEKTGEQLHGSLHIINNSDSYNYDDREYRVYHAEGYCFDIKKEKVDLAEDEINKDAIDGYEYTFYSQWEGFKELSVEEAMILIVEKLPF